jgi:hypothetical protein
MAAREAREMSECNSALLKLMSWLSPVFPTGGFAYSAGPRAGGCTPGMLQIFASRFTPGSRFRSAMAGNGTTPSFW